MSEYRTQHRRFLVGWLGPVAFVAGAAVAVPAPLAAQGAVSGRIAITERPGEQTTDFGSTVICGAMLMLMVWAAGGRNLHATILGGIGLVVTAPWVLGARARMHDELFGTRHATAA